MGQGGWQWPMLHRLVVAQWPAVHVHAEWGSASSRGLQTTATNCCAAHLVPGHDQLADVHVQAVHRHLRGT